MGFGNFQSFVMIPERSLVENYWPSSSLVGWTYNDCDFPSCSLEPLRAAVNEHLLSARGLHALALATLSEVLPGEDLPPLPP